MIWFTEALLQVSHAAQHIKIIERGYLIPGKKNRRPGGRRFQFRIYLA